jgi:hypothetical protein
MKTATRLPFAMSPPLVEERDDGMFQIGTADHAAGPRDLHVRVGGRRPELARSMGART